MMLFTKRRPPAAGKNAAAANVKSGAALLPQVMV